MADESLIASSITAVITTVIGIIILRLFKYFDKKDKDKEGEVKDSVRNTTDIIRSQLQKIVQESTEKNQDIHYESNTQLREEILDKMSEQIRDMNQRIKQEFENKTDVQSRTILNNIGSIENKLTSMINTLDMKTTMATDNVAKLRTDILDIQEEIDVICDKLAPKRTGMIPGSDLFNRSRSRDIQRQSIWDDQKQMKIKDDANPFSNKNLKQQAEAERQQQKDLDSDDAELENKDD